MDLNTNYSKCFAISNDVAKHAPLLPKHVVCVISGSTGCGKTNLLLNLLLKESVLDYDRIYIFCPTIHQPAYQYLKDYYNNLENIIRKRCNRTVQIVYFFENDEDLMDPSELDPNSNHIMIFDDCLLKDQTKIKNF